MCCILTVRWRSFKRGNGYKINGLITGGDLKFEEKEVMAWIVGYVGGEHGGVWSFSVSVWISLSNTKSVSICIVLSGFVKGEKQEE